MVTPWCVKVTCLPQGIKSEELANRFGIQQNSIDIPKRQGANYYAWVNGFPDELSAENFVKKWNRTSIRSSTITCKATCTKLNVLQRPPSMPRINSAQFTLNKYEEQLPSKKMDSRRRQSLTCGHTLTSVKSNVNDDSDDDDDTDDKVSKGHPSRADRSKFPHCSSTMHTDPSACATTTQSDIPSWISTSSYRQFRSQSRTREGSYSSQRGACRNGIDCFNPFCRFDHPPGWCACEDGVDCDNFDCSANHPYGRNKRCFSGINCKNIACQFLHPIERVRECEDGDQCRNWYCKALHEDSRPKPCFFGSNCYNPACQRLHPPDRRLCANGEDCTEFDCQLDHPSGRMMRCNQGNDCANFYCNFLHPTDWDPCEEGSKCRNFKCPHTTHPSDRILHLQQQATARKQQKQSDPLLKSVSQRKVEREQIQLPIFASKDIFCQRLKTERILVVTAETGSGKSTQLPQYAAEYFGGLVVCTQPRVVAAISLARRVADEYDGISVGRSVGYRVGHGGAGKGRNQVPGADIVFMTDSALIQESQEDRQLTKVKVLIIDEAHERSLNTDIVIGLAKLLLKERPTDFYVVIASATIDPIKFLKYFGREDVQTLNVPGRIYNISLECIPKSDDSTDEQHAVSILLQLYEKHQGHTLVFLPGQREIEQAIGLFNRDIPDNCVALPLYGSLSPEEQDKVLQFDEGPTGERRMVVFCTNIAETSLTIKNTRLVIDSGLAKEARFDTKRRLTVIETVRISRSSADQRKGRAGRTSSGHCVRLYKNDDLTRPNIEPEILRSSLDLVVLQLVRLNLNPQMFPFMDLPSPGEVILQQSLQLLKDLSCINTHNAITSRGELFAELDLDPRLSAFMVDAYIEHGPILEVAAAVVAILTAPGSLFFMGGATKEAKQEARGRVAAGAQEHESDFLYLVSVYEKWKKIGMIDSRTHMCITCEKTMKAKISCRSCRAAYSVTNALNNKVLNTIESSCEASINIITNKRWQLNPANLPNANHSNIIGIHLLKNFPEHYGHLLVPHLPNEGVCMVKNDFRARITTTSVFVQRQLSKSHFIAMTITQLPAGEYVIERLHPIDPSKTTSVKTIEKLFIVSNVGWEWNNQIRKEASTCNKEPWNKWLIYEYDRCQCNLTLWGEANMRDLIHCTIEPITKKTYDWLVSEKRSFDCGPIRATFEGGLYCLRIENKHENTSTKNRLDLHRIPCKTFEEFYKWMQETLDVCRKDIRENNFRPCKEPVMDEGTYESLPFFVVFDTDEAFNRALSHIPSFNVCPQKADAFDIVHMSEKETWGRQLLLKSTKNKFFTEHEIKMKFSKYIVSCKQIGKKLLPGIHISNMPASIDKADVQNALGNSLVPVRIDIFHSNKDNHGMGSSTVRAYFQDENQCDQAIVRLESSSFLDSHLIKIFSTKFNKIKHISVKPSIQRVNVEPPTFLITTVSRRIALNMYSKLQTKWTMNSSACATVTYLNLYPNFNDLVEGICSRFQVKAEKLPLPVKNNKSVAMRCIFTDATPPKTALAASMLSQATAPVIIKLTDERQKCLFKELFNENLIQAWTSELKLSCKKMDQYGAVIEIHGPQIEKGQLMRRIADYSDDFDHRYRVLDLSASIIGFFGRQKAAEIKLKEIDALWKQKGCSVTLVRRTSSIILYAQPKISEEMIEICEKEVKELLDKLATTSTTNDEQNDFCRQCAFCQRSMIATRVFRICGHAYCRCAITMLNKLPLKCPTCNSRIHIQDIQEMFSNSRADFARLCKKSIQVYLLSSTTLADQDKLFCPNDECDGLISRSRGYQTCLTCGQGVCGLCRLIEDELHEDCTCEERQKKAQELGDFMPCLFKAAEEFTRNNWPVDLPPIISIEKNAYLMQTSCESLDRFYQGVEYIGDKPPPDLARGVFAFHGTSINAIESICKSGFDPTRRRGQVYGPGEYFGITAAISHGYCKGSEIATANRMMIIAFILQCDRVKTQPGFCYVVNNPVDWSAAFNLPVAVVIYGKRDSAYPTTPFLFSTLASNNPNQLSNSIRWESPFRWHWKQDNRTFEPYNDKINDILEQFYETWKLQNGPSKIITPPLVRYVDDNPRTYEIDFTQQIQRNTKTNFVRRIERRTLPQIMTNTTLNWFYFNEHSAWAPYESMIQQTIENAYKDYASNQGSSKLVIRFPGRPEQYELNFVNGTQTNKITGEIRRIKRQ